MGFRRDGAWLFVFFSYLTLTASWAQYPSDTLHAMAVNSIFLLVWGLAYLLSTDYPPVKVGRMFTALPYVVAATFLYAYARFGSIRPYDEASMWSIGSIGNAAGLWLAVSLPFIYWLIRLGHKRHKRELYLSLFLIVLSQSRAGYLLAAFCLVSNAILYGKNIAQYVWGTVKAISLAIVVFVTAYYLPFTRSLVEEGMQRVAVNDVVASSTDAAQGNETVVDIERVWMFEQGFEAFEEHPYRGIGYDNISKRIEDAYGVQITSHNLFLTLIVESGWPAFLVFVTMIWAFFKTTRLAARTSSEESRGFYSACAIAMIAALLSGMAHPLLGFPLFYVVLAISYGAMRFEKPFAGERRRMNAALLAGT